MVCIGLGVVAFDKVACRSPVDDWTINGRLTLDACYAFRYSYPYQLPTYNLFSLCEFGDAAPGLGTWGVRRFCLRIFCNLQRVSFIWKIFAHPLIQISKPDI